MPETSVELRIVNMSNSEFLALITTNLTVNNNRSSELLRDFLFDVIV